MDVVRAGHRPPHGHSIRRWLRISDQADRRAIEHHATLVETDALPVRLEAVPIEERALKRLRAICANLPETVETLTFGHPTFQVRSRTYSVLEEYRGQLCICFKTSVSGQKRLVTQPRFFASPYIGRYGWVSMVVDGELNWTEVRELIHESYRQIAGKRLGARLSERT